jgi:hypothetical protein
MKSQTVSLLCLAAASSVSALENQPFANWIAVDGKKKLCLLREGVGFSGAPAAFAVSYPRAVGCPDFIFIWLDSCFFY